MLAAAGTKHSTEQEEVVFLDLPDSPQLPVIHRNRFEFSQIQHVSLKGIGQQGGQFIKTVLPALGQLGSLQTLDLSNNKLDGHAFSQLVLSCLFSSEALAPLAPLVPGSSRQNVCLLGHDNVYPVMESCPFLHWQHRNMVFDRSVVHTSSFGGKKLKLQSIDLSNNPVFGTIQDGDSSTDICSREVPRVDLVLQPWTAFLTQPELDNSVFPAFNAQSSSSLNTAVDSDAAAALDAVCALIQLLCARKWESSTELGAYNRIETLERSLASHDSAHNGITEEPEEWDEDDEELQVMGEESEECTQQFISIPKDLLEEFFNVLPSSHLNTVVAVHTGLSGKQLRFINAFVTQQTSSLQVCTTCNALNALILTETMLALHNDEYSNACRYNDRNPDVVALEQEFYKNRKYTKPNTSPQKDIFLAQIGLMAREDDHRNNATRPSTSPDNHTLLVYDLIEDDTAALDAMLDSDVHSSIPPKPSIQSGAITTATLQDVHIPDKMKFLYCDLDDDHMNLTSQKPKDVAFGIKGRSRVVMSNSTSIVLPRNQLEQEVADMEQGVSNMYLLTPIKPQPPSQPSSQSSSQPSSRPTSSKPVQPADKNVDQHTFKRASGSRKQNSANLDPAKSKAIVIPSSKIKKT